MSIIRTRVLPARDDRPAMVKAVKGWEAGYGTTELVTRWRHDVEDAEKLAATMLARALGWTGGVHSEGMGQRGWKVWRVIN